MGYMNYIATWLHGYMTIWASWLHGFMATWLHGLHGYIATWLHGAAGCKLLIIPQSEDYMTGAVDVTKQ
jgi:hypothetical protein